MTVTTRSRPTIAAVVVNYNYARFLPDAIASVLGQDRPFDEVVVVNDGSTDDSMSVLASYSESVRVLDIPNGGQLGACRAGLAATTCDYVYFLDADDYAHPDLVKTVAKHLPTEPVKVQFRLVSVSSSVQDLKSVFPTFPRQYDAARMRADNRSIGFYICPPTSGNVYSRRALLDLDLAACDQRDFIDGPATLALPYRGQIASINVALACYRVHGDNHSQWSEPTAELLAREIEWFGRRWDTICRLLGSDAPHAPGHGVLYRVERELMISALQNRARTPLLALRFLGALLPTHLPLRQKVMLTGWALALAVPLARTRRSLVRSRRSPLNRSPLLRGLVGLVLRGRAQ